MKEFFEKYSGDYENNENNENCKNNEDCENSEDI